jgi:hypothetical protein
VAIPNTIININASQHLQRVHAVTKRPFIFYSSPCMFDQPFTAEALGWPVASIVVPCLGEYCEKTGV